MGGQAPCKNRCTLQFSSTSGSPFSANPLSGGWNPQATLQLPKSHTPGFIGALFQPNFYLTLHASPQIPSGGSHSEGASGPPGELEQASTGPIHQVPWDPGRRTFPIRGKMRLGHPHVASRRFHQIARVLPRFSILASK